MSKSTEIEFKNKVDSVVEELQELAKSNEIWYVESVIEVLEFMKDHTHIETEKRLQQTSGLFRIITDDEYDFLGSAIGKKLRALMDEYQNGFD